MEFLIFSYLDTIMTLKKPSKDSIQNTWNIYISYFYHFYYRGTIYCVTAANNNYLTNEIMHKYCNHIMKSQWLTIEH